MSFPSIGPVAFEIGPLVIRWYSLAYITGLVLGWRYCIWLLRFLPASALGRRAIDDFFVWATLGIIIGGRLGYVLFYQPTYFVTDPFAILQIWKGGMSFHGGVLGVIAAIALFSRLRGISFLGIADLITAAVPIGLLFGRIANFFNGELWGRPTKLPWGVVFPGAGPEPRHPSQLYEAALEGLILFALLLALILGWRALLRPGLVSGAFLAGYGLARMAVETVREPDTFIGFLAWGTTWGQWLSVPMVLAGAGLIFAALRRQEAQSHGVQTGAGTKANTDSAKQGGVGQGGKR